VFRWVIAAYLLCAGVTAGAASEIYWGTWAEEARKLHPLAGSFYRTALTAPLMWSGTSDIMVVGKLFRPRPPDGRGPVVPAGIALLGEVHDNPTHHRLRAWMIENTAKLVRPWRPAMVFEQIRADQQPVLDRFTALGEPGRGFAGADELFRLLEWDKSGWPPAQIYRPLLEAALAAKLPMMAGDPPRDRVRAVARSDLSVVPPEEHSRLRLDSSMPPALLDALRRDLVDGHCGVLSAEIVERMSAAQRYRDAHLADALLTAAERGRDGFAILIAGNGHVRSDRGVPWHIRQRVPKSQVTSVVIVEVEEGKTDPELYVPRDPEGKPAADLVIFTPRAERGDPCEAMRKMKR
jgi:uncharacterized iron-regulated protein